MSLQAIRPQKQKGKQQQQQQQQSQANDQRQCTLQESIGISTLLLSTGLGCVTFLRGIFPERAYRDDKIDARKIPGLGTEKTNLRIKALQRGVVPEADSVLDYLEIGVKDALVKGYLKTFMFGIFLDPDHPHDLVELYTFNFVYNTHTTVDEHGNEENVRVPEMEIHDQLKATRLGSTGGTKDSRNGQTKWSMSEVRKQVQSLVKNLIVMTQNLSELPRDRYITFKLYYTPDTPADYEPPHFAAVDPEATKFRIGTHDAENQPETDLVGRVDTGHHCLTLRMASVADQLPDQDELRTSQLPGPPPAEEASQRAVVWDGEQLTLDEACDRSFETQQEKRETAKKRRPLGRLNPVSGQIVRTPSTSEGLGMDLEMEMEMETQNGTETERSIPARTHSMVDAEKLELARLAESQPVDSQETFPSRKKANKTIRDDDATRFGAESYKFTQEESMRLQRVQREETESMHPESLHRQQSSFTISGLVPPRPTQPAPAPVPVPASAPAPVPALRPVTPSESHPSVKRAAAQTETTSPLTPGSTSKTEPAPCDCGSAEEDGSMVECVQCQTWCHIVCHGYKDEASLPDLFHCYNCICRGDEDAHRDLSTLALYRRALQVVMSEDVKSARSLGQRLSIDAQTASSLWAQELQYAKKSSKDRRSKRDAQYFAPGQGEESEIPDKYGLQKARDTAAPMKAITPAGRSKGTNASSRSGGKDTLASATNATTPTKGSTSDTLPSRQRAENKSGGRSVEDITRIKRRAEQELASKHSKKASMSQSQSAVHEDEFDDEDDFYEQ